MEFTERLDGVSGVDGVLGVFEDPEPGWLASRACPECWSCRSVWMARAEWTECSVPPSPLQVLQVPALLEFTECLDGPDGFSE